MHHGQAEVSVLHLRHHLSSLLAVHLVPLAQPRVATGFLAVILVFWAFFDGWFSILTFPD
jgi:hypothetical protein